MNSTESTPEQIRILLLSDIHMNSKMLSLLKKWHTAINKGRNYDYLFVLGDIANLPNDNEWNAKDAISFGEGQIQALFLNDIEEYAD